MKSAQSPNPDQDLLRRAANGDHEAFGDLYILYLDQIYRYVNFRLPSPKDAEDLTEQIFLKAWDLLRRGKKSPEIRNFKAWIYRVAHNLVVDFHRKKKPLSVDFQEQTGQFIRSAENTEETVQRNLDKEDLAAAIAKLDDQSREIISLRFLQGLSHDEVAAILALTSGHVRVLQYRALKKLRMYITEETNE